jgi:hypothetical protein
MDCFVCVAEKGAELPTRAWPAGIKAMTRNFNFFLVRPAASLMAGRRPVWSERQRVYSRRVDAVAAVEF